MFIKGSKNYRIGQRKNCIFELGKFHVIPSEPSEAEVVLISLGYTEKIEPVIILAPAEIREGIERQIKSKCKFYLDQLTSEYSITKSIRFEEDKKQMLAGNTSHFNRRAGKHLTGSQYVETFIRPKITAGEYFADTVIGIETDLLIELSNTADADLEDFDCTTRWDALDDFVDPPVESVPSDWWSALKSKLLMRIW